MIARPTLQWEMSKLCQKTRQVFWSRARKTNRSVMLLYAGHMMISLMNRLPNLPHSRTWYYSRRRQSVSYIGAPWRLASELSIPCRRGSSTAKIGITFCCSWRHRQERTSKSLFMVTLVERCLHLVIFSRLNVISCSSMCCLWNLIGLRHLISLSQHLYPLLQVIAWLLKLNLCNNQMQFGLVTSRPIHMCYLINVWRLSLLYSACHG